MAGRLIRRVHSLSTNLSTAIVDNNNRCSNRILVYRNRTGRPLNSLLLRSSLIGCQTRSSQSTRPRGWPKCQLSGSIPIWIAQSRTSRLPLKLLWLVLGWEGFRLAYFFMAAGSSYSSKRSAASTAFLASSIVFAWERSTPGLG